MIVSNRNVQTALEYLSLDPHPLALAQKDKTDGENKRKECYARAYLAADGSIDARKAAAEIADEVISAKAEESEAILEVERHKARARASEMLLEIYRTESANVRAAESIR